MDGSTTDPFSQIIIPSHFVSNTTVSNYPLDNAALLIHVPQVPDITPETHTDNSPSDSSPIATSSRQWYKKLSDALLHEGFTQSQADYTLFTKGTTPSLPYSFMLMIS
uniref:Uncharacterized protein n=1 Tax=Cannabis sativa TaxID=3483 RepID=A0A803QQ32_CANSA